MDGIDVGQRDEALLVRVRVIGAVDAAAGLAVLDDVGDAHAERLRGAHRLAELLFVDELQRRRLAQALTDVLSR